MRWPILLAAVWLWMLAACQAVPSATRPAQPPGELSDTGGGQRRLKLSVGPPAATLYAWIVEPPANIPTKGTILFLHGFMMDHAMLLKPAEALRLAGYRAVLVDLRGFGQSTGDMITYGAFDAADLGQLVSALQQMNLCGKFVGVYGVSYGACAAITFAAADDRVKAIVAVAAGASPRKAMPAHARFLMQGAAALTNNPALDPDGGEPGASPLEAMPRIQCPVLLIHGESDLLIDPKSAAQLHAARPEKTELLMIPNRGHIDLCFDSRGELAPKVRQWFEEHLAE